MSNNIFSIFLFLLTTIPLFQADTDITYSWGVKAPVDLAATELPLQVQIRYTALDGTKLLRVISRNLPASNDRNKTEAMIDTAVVSIHAIHRAADLAHKGDYQAARVTMVAAMHFIQRSMKNKESQKDYISFILQGEVCGYYCCCCCCCKFSFPRLIFSLETRWIHANKGCTRSRSEEEWC